MLFERTMQKVVVVKEKCEAPKNRITSQGRAMLLVDTKAKRTSANVDRSTITPRLNKASVIIITRILQKHLGIVGRYILFLL